jgi:membrane fusion protein (multidrug efflux system)
MKHIIQWTGCSLTALVLLTSCGSKPQQQAPPPTSVNVVDVTKGDAVYYDEYPATITPLNQVDIKPQVAGNITGIFFKDGQQVHKGQKLYQIDQQQYQAAYEQAVANVSVSEANLVKAQQDADRYTFLAQQDAIAKQILDHALADLESAKKQLAAAKANVNSVETNLKYAAIYAPFDGTIGISQVKVGTAVYAQTLLNTVSSDNPIAVDIAIDQTEIVRFNNYLQKGTNAADSVFTISLPDGSVYPHPGNVYLLDRAVDPQTGTIKTRLVFDNPKSDLKAGVTCNIRVKNNSGSNTLLIPYKAVVEQLGEFFVFIDADNKALQRKVVLGNKINDKVIVKSGLNGDEKIITDGVQKVRDSSAIQVGPPKKPQQPVSK